MFSIAFLVVFYPILQPCFAIETNVTRSLQDTFSVSNCTSCAKFNQATCFREGVCRCPSVESTFFIYKQRCESSASLIIDQDCLRWPGDKNRIRLVDLTSTSSSQFYKTSSACRVLHGRIFAYLRREGNWTTHRLQGDGRVFAVEKSKRGMVLKILGNNDLVPFAGRIIRIDLLCKGLEGEMKSCLILKAKGTLSSVGRVSPSQGIVPTIQHGGPRTTLASTSEKMKRTGTKEPSTPRIHYIGSQSKSRFTPTPSNSTVITQARINGAVSIDKTNKKGDTVVVAIISVLGAIACVLVIGALFAWFVIKYYQRFSLQDQRSTPQSIVIGNNQDMQNTIPMTTMTTTGRLSEPVYSELPDVVESANRNTGPAEISLPVDNQDDFFIIRNPLQYNTLPLPKGRKLTDPLPATPPDRSQTPDLRLTHRTASGADPNATKTAQFLSDVSKNLSVRIPVPQDSKRRKRSSTDVHGDAVFFENFSAKGLVLDMEDGRTREERAVSKSTQSIYEDLSETSKESRLSVYEPLEKATLQPPDVRKTTLERINTQVSLDEEDSVPEYQVLEPPPEQEANEQVDLVLETFNPDKKSQGTFSGGAKNTGPYSPPMTEHHTQEGPHQDMDQSRSNQGLEFDDDSSNISKDGLSHVHGHCRARRTSEKIFLRPRSRSSEF